MLFFKFSFLRTTHFAQFYLRNKNTLFSVGVHEKEKKLGFQVWKICELSKRENLILCECDWDYSSLGKILEFWLSLQFAYVRSTVVRRKILFFFRVSVVSESRWDKDGVMCVSIGVEHSVWVTCNWVSYFVTDLSVIVKCENPTGGGSWFFTLVGHKVFHVRILVFFIFHIICLLLSQDQSVRSV